MRTQFGGLVNMARAIVCAASVAVPAIALAESPGKQAVVDTTAGVFILDLAPDQAPNQTAYFTKTAQEGGYDGTTFHRMVKYGMVQRGDPLSKNPARRAQYGTGGL